MAQTLNFKTKQELDAYLAQNPQIKGTIQGFGMDGQTIAPKKDFLSSLIGGVVDPFLGLGQKGLELGASIGASLDGKAGIDKYLTGSKDYKPTFMNSEEYNNFSQNPLLSTVKDVAGVGSFFVPIGKAGQGIGALAKNSALASGLSSFANQDKENTGNINLGQIGSDALLGGALGGGIGVLQKGLPKGLGNAGNTTGNKITDTLDKFAEGRDLNVFKRAVGSPAPSKLGGALLEKESANLANKFGVKINSADDLVKMSDDILGGVGGDILKVADEATQAGIKTDFLPAIQKIEDKLSKTISPELRQPLEEVLGSIKTIAPDGQLTPTQAYTLKQEFGKLGKFNPLADPSQASKASVYTDLYGTLNNQLKNSLEQIGYKNFDETNKLLETAIKQKSWAENSALKNRPVASLNDMAQDVGGFVGLASGNPLMAIPGAVAGKVLQSPITEKALAGGARGISSLIKGATPEAGGALSGIGKFLQNGAGVASNIANSQAGQVLQRGLPFGIGSQAFNQPQQIGQDQTTTDMASQAQTGQVASQATDPRIAQAYQQLVTPVKQGGMGLSNSDAEAYMINVLGVNPPSAQKSGTAKTTESQKKFLAAGQLANEALQSLNAGKVSTGKIASVGNTIGQFLGNQSPEQTDYLSKLAGARGSAVSALSGANVPPSEYARIADMIPEVTDEPAVAKQKLKSFANAMSIYANAGS